MNLVVLTEPPVEPLTLAEAKAHCRVDDDITAQDAYITALIVVARRAAEHITRRAMVQRTLLATFDCFPYNGVIELPAPPLASVTSIKYTDTSGVEQTVAVADYQVDTYREPGLVKPAYGCVWPLSRNDFNAVRVTYVAGYPLGAGSPTDYTSKIPATFKQWLKLRIGAWYEHREPIMVGTIVTDLKRDYIDGLLDELVVNLF